MTAMTGRRIGRASGTRRFYGLLTIAARVDANSPPVAAVQPDRHPARLRARASRLEVGIMFRVLSWNLSETAEPVVATLLLVTLLASAAML